jgi:hypothetical protein
MTTQATGKPECKDAGVTVAFKVDSDELDQNARGALDGVATWLKGDERRTLFLEGFADTTGQAESNLVLSSKRAAAVKSYLMEHGVEGSRVATVGRGEEIDHLPANGRAVTFLACQSAVPGPAVAQLETPPVTPVEPVESEPAEVAPVAVPAAPRAGWASRFGWAVMAGGNYTDFTSGSMRDVTAGGGGWDARFIGGTHSIIGFEAAYVGAANSINSLAATSNNPTLIQNGLQGTGRLNIPIRKGASLFEPYGYAGLGYSRFHVSNYNSATGTLSSFNGTDDNTMTVPFGGGFAYAYKAFIADVRAGWTAVYYDNLMNNIQSTNGALNHWNAGGQIGFMF